VLLLKSIVHACSGVKVIGVVVVGAALLQFLFSVAYVMHTKARLCGQHANHFYTVKTGRDVSEEVYIEW
jgi:hypothetical protein